MIFFATLDYLLLLFARADKHIEIIPKSAAYVEGSGTFDKRAVK